jgi:hypothetical protein
MSSSEESVQSITGPTILKFSAAQPACFKSNFQGNRKNTTNRVTPTKFHRRLNAEVQITNVTVRLTDREIENAQPTNLRHRLQ